MTENTRAHTFLSVRFLKKHPITILLFCLLLGVSIWTAVNRNKWGLKGQYYPNPCWEGKPTVSKVDETPHLQGSTGYQLLSTNKYSVKWTGWIAIHQTGRYRFATNSDDGSYLYLDTHLLIDNGGSHGPRKITQEIDLKKGIYPLEIRYFQAGGMSLLQTSLTTPQEEESPLSPEILFPKKPDNIKIVLRQIQIILIPLLKILWGCLFLYSCHFILKTYVASYRNIFRTFRALWNVNKRVALWTAVFFLIGLLALGYLSQNHPIDHHSQLEWTLHTNENEQHARFAIDRQVTTSWRSNQPMKPGMFFQVDFHDIIPIEKVTLSYGSAPYDFPRGFRLESSNDGKNWETVPLADCRVSPTATDIYLEPVKTRYFKITQTGQSQKYWWSIDELSFFQPSLIPRAYQYPLFLIFSCGLAGSLLFIGFSYCSTFRELRKSVLLGLILLALFGFSLRIFILHQHDLHVDEIVYLSEALNVIDSDLEWAKQTFNKDHRMTALLYISCMRWLSKLFEMPSLAVRLMSAILGTSTIFLLFVVWKSISSRKEAWFEALLAAGMLSSLVYHICWSRDGHGQIQMSFFYLLYLFIASTTFTSTSRFKRLFFGSGIFLFLGFFFHGSMLVAPIGVGLFALFDALLSRSSLFQQQKFNWKGYLPLFLSAVLFAAYLYYALFMQGGLVDAQHWSGSEGSDSFNSISHLINFFQTRWQLLLSNSDFSWWKAYGIPNWFSGVLLILMIAGGVDMLRRRQKTEWFIITQPIVFCFIISLLWHTSNFERFLIPIVFSMTCLTARGANVTSSMFKHPRIAAASRILISVLVVSVLTSVSISGIFLEEPQYQKKSSWVYRVYGGRETSLLTLLKYIKQSPRGANSIICNDLWRSQYYAKIFHLNIGFLQTSDLVNVIKNAQILPLFVLVERTQHRNQDLIATLEAKYNLVGLSLSESNSLYELRNSHQLQTRAFSRIPSDSSLKSQGSFRFRSDAKTLRKDDIVSTIRHKGLNHPDDLSQYNLSGANMGTARHNYELITSNSEHLVIEQNSGLMWKQSGTSKPVTWKEAERYVTKLNQEQYAGYTDWRLPTSEECASLIEPYKQQNHLYLQQIFDTKQQWCWTSDTVAGLLNAAWIVNFYHGNISYRYQGAVFYVRAVRSMNW